jgi:hypothetical protein
VAQLGRDAGAGGAQRGKAGRAERIQAAAAVGARAGRGRGAGARRAGSAGREHARLGRCGSSGAKRRGVAATLGWCDARELERTGGAGASAEVGVGGPERMVA